MSRTPKTTRPARLWALAITVAPEADEAVAEWLAHYTDRSPITSHSRVTGLSTVTAYIEDPGWWTPVRRRETRLALGALREFGLEPGPATVRWRRVADADWRESWKRHFPPLSIQGRLLVRPSWSRARPAAGQVEVVLDPGLSFGTGQHPTTAFCLREVVRGRPRREPGALLDVGTGSGILAIAAARLGYAPVDAFDFDGEAVEIARRNAAANGVADRIRLRRLDVRRLAPRPRRRYEVVCANLTANLLLEHAELLVAQLAPGAHLVLAGILAGEFESVADRFLALGLREVRRRCQREWCSGLFVWPSA
ncbi:MAG: 50S ribosomal protein L11 methyltransferase [Verrucomicrobiae bacterium]|nr:50S ribosomal protein L11 methyltransferase [Verrucomicrobiae bacterium]